MDYQKYFTKLQIVKMRIYCKTCKSHTSNIFPKKIVLISNNKIKGNLDVLFV